MKLLSSEHGVFVTHDGCTEWCDCADCGAHLDPCSDSTPADWDGGCWLCGAPVSRVGLVTRYWGAVDKNRTGAVYGVGETPDAAVADAIANGSDPEAEKYNCLPITDKAHERVLLHGGAPGTVVVQRDLICTNLEAR